MTDPTTRDLIQRLADALTAHGPLPGAVPLLNEARAYLAQLEPDGPAVTGGSEPASVAYEPIPLSERQPTEADCDAEGRCWLLGKIESDWRLISMKNPGIPKLTYCFSHWLPHWALPVPQEVE